MSKVKIILTIFIISISVGGYYFFNSTKVNIEYSTYQVARGLITQSVEATGKVESVGRIDLNFKITGRIESIMVNVGDEVVENQIIARLEAQALESKVVDAQANLKKVLADYDKLIAGASAEDVKVAQDTLEQKQQGVVSARNSLTALKTKSNAELQNLKDTLIIKINNELSVAGTALDVVNNTLEDDDAKNTLGILGTDLVFNLKKTKNNASDVLENNKKEMLSITSSASDQAVLTAADSFRSTLDLVAGTLSDTIDVLNATLTSSDLSQTELDTLKSNITAQQTAISTSKNTVQTARSNWLDKKASYDDSIIAAQDAITDALSAEQVAKSQLALKESPPRSFEISAQEAFVDQARAALSLARANLNEAIITAPTNGVITEKNYEIGEQTSQSLAVFEMIGNNRLEIEVDIPESDITKLSVNQGADITLDAFTDERVFPGTIVFIDPAETVIQDVVYYQVKAQFNENYDEVKPGMTANVTIYTDRKDNVLFVPLRAVKSRNGDKYVEVLRNGEVIEKIITTGLRGDEGVEVISGLSEGDDVITFVKEN
ncbi:MAG: efflux RND transporter periplasmic adaptor subunit [bacterium]|nr:efflux RND transporter periplasmic adaptor subunit [bacterium]